MELTVLNVETGFTFEVERRRGGVGREGGGSDFGNSLS